MNNGPPSIDAVVAAGGTARRFGGEVPKSLLTVDGVSLIVRTVRSLVESGVRHIIVVNNRREFDHELIRVLRNYPTVLVVPDQGVESTVKLLPLVEPLLVDRFFFLYRHAPRPVHHIKEMLACKEGIIVTRTLGSSRRAPLEIAPRLFAEPPFLFPHCIAEMASVMTWGDILAFFRSEVKAVKIDGPHEFNTELEFDRYKRYLRGNDETWNSNPAAWNRTLGQSDYPMRNSG